jgi:hypothetical protein
MIAPRGRSDPRERHDAATVGRRARAGLGALTLLLAALACGSCTGDGASNAPQHRVARDGWDVRVWTGGNTDTSIEMDLFERAGKPALLRIDLSNGA